MGQRIPPTRGSGRGSSRGRDRDPGSGPGSSPDGRLEPEPRPIPLDETTNSSAIAAGRAPFAWQHGNRLFLLEREQFVWVMAELRFDVADCHYVEVRRSRYRWAREAAGALLGRALAAGDAAVDDLARNLQSWIATAVDSRR